MSQHDDYDVVGGNFFGKRHPIIIIIIIIIIIMCMLTLKNLAKEK